MSLNRAFLFCFVLLFCVDGAASAQDGTTTDNPDSGDTGSYFGEGDTVVADDAPTLVDDVATTDGILFSGVASASAYAIAGTTVTDWDAALSGAFDASAYGTAKLILKMEARPVSYFGVYGEAQYAFPDGTKFDWSDLKLSELYFDYTLLDTATFKIGKQIAAMGQGYLFTPADFLDGIETGYALKTSLPLNPFGFTAYLFSAGAGFTTSDPPTIAELAYAGTVECTLQSLLLSVNGFYQVSAGSKLGLSAKVSVLGFDIYGDAVLSAVETAPAFTGVFGFFKDWTDPRILVMGEYMFDSRIPNDHRIIVATGWSGIFGSSTKAAVKWSHGFADGSGSLIAGLEWQALTELKLSAAVPFFYGAEGTRYVLTNEDPGKRRLSFVIKADFTFAF